MNVEDAVEKYIGEPAVFVGAMMLLILMLPVWLPVGLACLIGKLLLKLGTVGYELARGDEYQRELRRTIRARNKAIRNIVALHQRAERDMAQLMRERNRRRVLTRRERSL